MTAKDKMLAVPGRFPLPIATLPARTAAHDGLAYALWLPGPGVEVKGGVVVLHGAGSAKENHYDYARAATGWGLAALVFDQRGHGQSDGALDARAVSDIAAMAGLLRARIGDGASPIGGGSPIALRGSSMGGYFAIAAAGAADARAVVAICPADPEQLRRGIAARRFAFAADRDGLDALLGARSLTAAVDSLEVALLLMHAEGDEQVPVQQSRELITRARRPGSRLITVPGGHHRSIQHDEELQDVSLRFIARAFAGGFS